ncbi:MAG: helix-turn-helix transcriptional regulator [Porticoccaceae bacterium]|nr:helix-turn-helix transcriptional regulator [Porticoccaceae bacterium]
MHWRFRSEHIESVLVEAFHLTPRELDVVEWLINGKSNWDIAQILDISESTVKVHAASVLKKLGAESRAAVPALVSGL